MARNAQTCNFRGGRRSSRQRWSFGGSFFLRLLGEILQKPEMLLTQDELIELVKRKLYE
jgi:hypothetical protein